MIRKCNSVREIQSRSTNLTYLIDLKGIIRQQFLPICGVVLVIHYNTQLDLSFSIDWLYFVVVYKDDLICNSVFINSEKKQIASNVGSSKCFRFLVDKLGGKP